MARSTGSTTTAPGESNTAAPVAPLRRPTGLTRLAGRVRRANGRTAARGRLVPLAGIAAAGLTLAFGVTSMAGAATTRPLFPTEVVAGGTAFGNVRNVVAATAPGQFSVLLGLQGYGAACFGMNGDGANFPLGPVPVGLAFQVQAYAGAFCDRGTQFNVHQGTATAGNGTIVVNISF